MEANAGMVAGSYKRNELVRIRHDSEGGVSCLSCSARFVFLVFLFAFESGLVPSPGCSEILGSIRIVLIWALLAPRLARELELCSGLAV